MAAKKKPVYLIAGGRGSMPRRGPDPLFQKALQLADIARPTVAYIGAASGDNALFRIMMARTLRKAGAGEIRLAPLCGSRADPQKAMGVVENSHIVFMSGGDVEEGMKILADRGMTDFLQDQHQKGKPFFGLSAGSIMLAKQWVRWRDPEVDSSAELFPCLGLAEVYCDAHDEENDWEELRILARLIPIGSVTYGIPSGTAMAAYPDGTIIAINGELHRFRSKGRAVAQIENLTP
jgi:peptidase E